MARQPRFIEDDEPIVPRKSSGRTARFEDDSAKPAKVPVEEDTRPAEIDVDGDDNGSEYEPPRGGGKRIALIIAAILLGLAIIGAGVYALVHFVFMPDSAGNAVTESEVPTVSDEPTLAPTPTHATEAPTEAPTEPDYAAMADTYLAKMSDYEKLCQLFIVTPEVLTSALDDSDSDAAVTVAGSMTEKSLEKYPVGGIIYFADNLEDIDQTEEMIANSQKYASTPLFIAVDEEGGDVARVADKLGTKAFKPMLEYKDEGTEVAHDNAEVISSNLRVVGFNMDNAPVADVLSNPDNTVIGSRAYSDDYAQAAELVAAAVEGFHDGGVVTVLKHFPGHGGTDEDSHDGLAYVDTSVEELKKNELLPFKAGIEAGTDMVMVGHLVVTDLDPDMPASLSSKVVPELLRKELGYDGIVITDSMSMAAITYDYDTTVRGLFAADVDVILQPDNLDRYIEAIQNLLDSGEITQAQIDAKVKKILTLKYKQGIMKAVQPDPVGETIAPADNATEAPADNAANAVEQPTDAALPEEQPTAA